jgi:hypothetical protein
MERTGSFLKNNAEIFVPFLFDVSWYPQDQFPPLSFSFAAG